ncbi:hypothetical protein L914_12610, partial [Phytophthora nicotianae]
SGLLLEDTAEVAVEGIAENEQVLEETGSGVQLQSAEGVNGDDITPFQIDASTQKQKHSISRRVVYKPTWSSKILPLAYGCCLRHRHWRVRGDDNRVARAAVPTSRPGRARIPLSPNDDINVFQDGDNNSDYISEESDGDGISDDGHDFEYGGIDEEVDVLSDSDAVEMDRTFLASLQVGSSTVSGAAKQTRKEALRSIPWTQVSTEHETDITAFPGLSLEEARPIGGHLAIANLHPLLLHAEIRMVTTTTEKNRYNLHQAIQAYGVREILHVVELIVAQMLCPQKRCFPAHRSMVDDDVIPAGLFWWYMTLDRCQRTLRDLHFVDNIVVDDRDKLWKVQPVVDHIQQRFLASWSLPAVLPTTSSRNTICNFMSGKPHRHGSKLFMLCDANTAYNHNYVGKHNNDDGGDPGVYFKTGAAAVVRNLKFALIPNLRHPWHAGIIDRYYASVILAVEFLEMQIDVIGTIQTNRLGFNKNIQSKSKTNPPTIPRGHFSYSCSVAVPSIYRTSGGIANRYTTCVQAPL